MHNLGVNLRINTLINKYSINDVEFIIDIASKYVKEINFFTIVFLGRGFRAEDSDGVSIEEHLKMSKKIEKLKKKYKSLRILHFAEVSHTTSVNQKSKSKFLLEVGPPSGFTTFNVLSNGDYACGGYSPYISNELKLGNIKKENIFDIWQNNKVLEKIRNDSHKLILFCNSCEKFKNKQCQGSKYETELIRLINPEVKNPTCIFGEGPSLLEIC
jgi:MoaA/NifB/PqqE/SkfB family radical SAM enzyme